MVASSRGNAGGVQVFAPGPTTPPKKVDARRNDRQRDDRFARLQREERGIVDHDVDIDRDDHDADNHHGRRPYEEADAENDSDEDFKEWHAPPGELIEGQSGGKQLPRPGFGEHRHDELHRARHDKEDGKEQTETAGQFVVKGPAGPLVRGPSGASA